MDLAVVIDLFFGGIIPPPWGGENNIVYMQVEIRLAGSRKDYYRNHYNEMDKCTRAAMRYYALTGDNVLGFP